MENEALQVSKTINGSTIDQYLKLIDGVFTKREALDVINNVVVQIIWLRHNLA